MRTDQEIFIETLVSHEQTTIKKIQSIRRLQEIIKKKNKQLAFMHLVA